jgi:4-hydroxymandelate oxidase
MSTHARTDLVGPPRAACDPWLERAGYAELREAARRALEPGPWDFMEGGAGDERTMSANEAAFRRWTLLPRAMSGAPLPSLATTVLGMELSMPLLTAPFGVDALFHPDGQLAIARANARAGTASIVPEAGSFALEAFAETGVPRIMQLHPVGPDDNFLRLADRAAAAGYRALCVTVDCPVRGWRERNERNGYDPGLEVMSGCYPPGGPVSPEQVFGHFFAIDEPTWTWDRLALVTGRAGLPWIAKGILTPSDARAALEAGASAVVVSNHGGRQLEPAPASLDQLPAVRAEVGDHAEVLFDSGVRRGTDVLTALALGADAVILGRLAIYALTAAGEPGVLRLLELLRREMTTTLALMGRASSAQLGPHDVQAVPG